MTPRIGRDARPGDRLPVGDDGQGLERGLRQAAALPVTQEVLDDVGVGRSGEEPHPAGDLTQFETGVALVVGRPQRVERAAHGLGRLLQRGRQRRDRDRRLDDEQDGLDRGAQVGRVGQSGREHPWQLLGLVAGCDLDLDRWFEPFGVGRLGVRLVDVGGFGHAYSSSAAVPPRASSASAVSVPVQRTRSSVRASAWSKATAPSR